ncbi:hypothetical protein AA313_de0201055 [Arthrobotrys entomopaga]|nr:hypothetical protein AA313_de0201055 [Arthrobotrys entomopaga]
MASLAADMPRYANEYRRVVDEDGFRDVLVTVPDVASSEDRYQFLVYFDYPLELRIPKAFKPEKLMLRWVTPIRGDAEYLRRIRQHYTWGLRILLEESKIKIIASCMLTMHSESITNMYLRPSLVVFTTI